MDSFLKLLLDFFKNVFGISDSKDDGKVSLVKKFDYETISRRRDNLKEKYENIKYLPETGIHSTVRGKHSEGAEYSEDEIILVADNMLNYQNPDGGWGKNGNYRVNFSKKELKRIYENPSDAKFERSESDFDNKCTWGHFQYVSLVYNLTGENEFRKSAEKALRFIVKSQHRNGSWENKNHRHITYNDKVMSGVLKTILEILVNEGGKYDFIQDLADELKLEDVYMRGIECVLATQIERDGVKGVWAQQHDHETLEPTWGRSYEMPAYVSAESFDVIRLLRKHMEHYPKDKRVKKSIDAAIEFLRKVQLPDGGFARFYHLENLRPIFANRDSKITYDIEDILPERRYGYGWFVKCPDDLF